MAPERRIALVSVAAALVLIGIKLGTGLASGSLGLLSEAAHSGTDLAAALLTFFAVGVAVRPADRGHPYGHGKAAHLAALAEASVLVVVSAVIAVAAIRRLAGAAPHELTLAWWVFVGLAAVIAIDASRAVVSWRASRRYRNAALAANALHFVGDLGGTIAVLVGLLAARAGYPEGDSAAALFVAALVVVAAGGLARQNVDVLMDRTPTGAHDAASRAIEAIEPRVELRRLRMRHAAGRHFADVVIGVPRADAIEQVQAAADAVELAVEEAVPGADVVVHVEPRGGDDAALRDRVHAAALRIPRVREIHNVSVLRAGGHTEISLHVKLPGSLPLGEAHAIASEVEAAIRADVPGADSIQTHLEPLGEEAAGDALPAAASESERDAVRRIVVDVTGRPPRDLRLYRTDEGLVVFLTLALDPDRALADAHGRATEIEQRVRSSHADVADVVVHTEP